MSQAERIHQTWRSTSKKGTTSGDGGDPPTTHLRMLTGKIVEKADKYIRHGFGGVDQTSKKAKAFIPAAHYLESWGDARTMTVRWCRCSC